MTISDLISKVLNLARLEIGYHEKASNSQLDDKAANSGSGNWTKYARDIDALKVTWGNKNGFAYCAEWCLWIFYKIFGIDLALAMLCSPNPTGIPACSFGVRYFKQAGRWFTSNPQSGDIIFFHDGEVVSHQGIVESVSGNIVTTIEANTTDMVARRAYAIGDPRIHGYGRPRWELALNSGSEQDYRAYDMAAKPLIHVGSKGQYVKILQESLIKLGFYCGTSGADGEFGQATLAAVKNFQSANGLEVDGIVGNATWKMIEELLSKAPTQRAENVVSNEKAIWDRLYTHVGNDYAVAGIMGNFYAESVLRSNNVQDTSERRLGLNDEQYTAAVDRGTYGNFVRDSVGYGLYQATYWSIKQHMLDYAKSHSKSIGDRDMQVDAFVDLLKKDYKSLWDSLKSATSVRQASNEVLLKFERPANQGTSVQNARALFGQRYYDKYAGKGVSVIIGDTIEQPKSDSQRPMLKRGSTGLFVKELQEKLISIGYSCGRYGADGEFGNDTYNAVIRFQKDRALEVDGVVGPNTWKALMEVNPNG